LTDTLYLAEDILKCVPSWNFQTSNSYVDIK